MTTTPTPLPALRVTVHAAAPEERSGELLGYGLLAAPRTVLVPSPPPELADPWQRLFVRIAEVPDGGAAPEGETPPEAIRAGGIFLTAYRGPDFEASAAVLTLLSPSRYRNAVAVHTRDQLGEALQRHYGDLWETFAELGYPVARPEVDREPGDWWHGNGGDQLSAFLNPICCVSYCRPCAAVH
ncbi:hypothetical protein ACIA8O_14910 [Kitasatospora sp. NPDC051853]|uniref:hypothetical protein n=1 Tax=Kitasatospora sp. NPDC051853 TaxID=3364058 RepID=UPI0037906264